MNILHRSILQKSQENRNYTARNLSNLVRIKSLSREEELVQNQLRYQMELAGFDEVRMDALGNVIGRIGKGDKILAFDGHIDTVDAGRLDNWDFDPFGGEIRDGYVLGRGTVDQEGGVAAFITAGKMIKEIGIPEDMSIYFIGSVMEEDCDGLCWKYIIEESGLRPDWVVSTEPTDLNIYIGQRGRMEMHVDFYGRSSHGSAPERGDNAIYKAAKVAMKIEELNKHLKVDDFLGKGSITISEIISNSPSLCAVSDHCRIHLDRRLTWGESKDSAVREIQQLIQGMDAEVSILNYLEDSFTGFRYGMEKYFPTWKMEIDHPLVTKATTAFKELFKKESKLGKWTFSTNGVVINGIHGIPVIGFGPGEEALAHSPNEKVAIEDLVTASSFYTALAYQLSSKD